MAQNNMIIDDERQLSQDIQNLSQLSKKLGAFEYQLEQAEQALDALQKGNEDSMYVKDLEKMVNKIGDSDKFEKRMKNNTYRIATKWIGENYDDIRATFKFDDATMKNQRQLRLRLKQLSEERKSGAVIYENSDPRGILLSQYDKYLKDESKILRDKYESVQKKAELAKAKTTNNKAEATIVNPLESIKKQQKAIYRQIKDGEGLLKDIQSGLFKDQKAEDKQTSLVNKQLKEIKHLKNDIEAGEEALYKKEAQLFTPKRKMPSTPKQRYSTAGAGTVVTGTSSKGQYDAIIKMRKRFRTKSGNVQGNSQDLLSKTLNIAPTSQRRTREQAETALLKNINSLVLDTETTGTGENDLPVIIGYTGNIGKQIKSGQVLLRTGDQEKTIANLVKAMNLLDKNDRSKRADSSIAIRKYLNRQYNLQLGMQEAIDESMLSEVAQKIWNDSYYLGGTGDHSFQQFMLDQDFDLTGKDGKTAIVGHNFPFDIKKIFRLNGITDDKNKLGAGAITGKNLKKIDTESLFMSFFGGDGSHLGKTFKKADNRKMLLRGDRDGKTDYVLPDIFNVSSIYEWLYNETFDAHDAEADTQAEFQVYKTLLTTNIGPVIGEIIEEEFIRLAKEDAKAQGKKFDVKDLDNYIFSENGGQMKSKYERAVRRIFEATKGIGNESESVNPDVLDARIAKAMTSMGDSRSFVENLKSSFKYTKTDASGAQVEDKDRKNNKIKVFTGEAIGDRLLKLTNYRRGYQDFVAKDGQVGSFSRSLQDIYELAQDSGLKVFARQIGDNIEIGFIPEDVYDELTDLDKTKIESFDLGEDKGFYKAHIELSNEDGFLSSGEIDRLDYMQLYDKRTGKYTDAQIVGTAVRQAEHLKSMLTRFPGRDNASLTNLINAKRRGEQIDVSEMVDKAIARGRQKNPDVGRTYNQDNEVDKALSIDGGNTSKERQAIMLSRINYEDYIQQTAVNKRTVGMIQSIGDAMMARGNTKGYKYQNYYGSGSGAYSDVTQALRKLAYLQFLSKGNEDLANEIVGQWDVNSLEYHLWQNKDIMGEGGVSIRQYLKNMARLSDLGPSFTGMSDSAFAQDAINLISARDIQPFGFAIQSGYDAPTKAYNRNPNFANVQDKIDNSADRIIGSEYDSILGEDRADIRTYGVGTFTQEQFDKIFNDTQSNLRQKIEERWRKENGTGVKDPKKYQDFLKQYRENFADKLIVNSKVAESNTIRRVKTSEIISEQDIQALLKSIGAEDMWDGQDFDFDKLTQKQKDELSNVNLNKMFPAMAAKGRNWNESKNPYLRGIKRTQGGYTLKYEEDFINDKWAGSLGERVTRAMNYDDDMMDALIQDLGEGYIGAQILKLSDAKPYGTQGQQDVGYRKMYAPFAGRLEQTAYALLENNLDLSKMLKGQNNKYTYTYTQNNSDGTTFTNKKNYDMNKIFSKMMYQDSEGKMRARYITSKENEDGSAYYGYYDKKGNFIKVFDDPAEAAAVISYVLDKSDSGMMASVLGSDVAAKYQNMEREAFNLHDVADYSGVDATTKVKSTLKYRNSFRRRYQTLGLSEKEIEDIGGGLLTPNKNQKRQIGRAATTRKKINDSLAYSARGAKDKFQTNDLENLITLRLLGEEEDYNQALQETEGTNTMVITKDMLKMSNTDGAYMSEEEYANTLSGRLEQFAKSRGISKNKAQVILDSGELATDAYGGFESKSLLLPIDRAIRDTETGTVMLSELQRGNTQLIKQFAEIEEQATQDMSEEDQQAMRVKRASAVEDWRSTMQEMISDNKSALMQAEQTWEIDHSTFFKPEQFETHYATPLAFGGDVRNNPTGQQLNTVFMNSEMFRSTFGSDAMETNTDIINQDTASLEQLLLYMTNQNQNTKAVIEAIGKDIGPRERQQTILDLIIKEIKNGNTRASVMLTRPPFIEGFEGSMSHIAIDDKLYNESIRMSEDLLKQIGGDTDGDQIQAVANLIRAKTKRGESLQKIYETMGKAVEKSDEIMKNYFTMEEVAKTQPKKAKNGLSEKEIDQYSRFLGGQGFSAGALSKQLFNSIGIISNAGTSFAVAMDNSGIYENSNTPEGAETAIKARLTQSVLQIFEQEAISSKKLAAKLMKDKHKIVKNKDTGKIEVVDSTGKSAKARGMEAVQSVALIGDLLSEGQFGQAMQGMIDSGFTDFNIFDNKQLESAISQLGVMYGQDANGVLARALGLESIDIFQKDGSLDANKLKSLGSNKLSPQQMQGLFDELIASTNLDPQQVFNFEKNGLNAKGEAIRKWDGYSKAIHVTEGAEKDSALIDSRSLSGTAIKDSSGERPESSDYTLRANVVNVYGDKVNDNTTSKDEAKGGSSKKGKKKTQNYRTGEIAESHATPNKKGKTEGKDGIGTTLGGNWALNTSHVVDGLRDLIDSTQVLAQHRNKWSKGNLANAKVTDVQFANVSKHDDFDTTHGYTVIDKEGNTYSNIENTAPGFVVTASQLGKDTDILEGGKTFGPPGALEKAALKGTYFHALMEQMGKQDTYESASSEMDAVKNTVDKARRAAEKGGVDGEENEALAITASALDETEEQAKLTYETIKSLYGKDAFKNGEYETTRAMRIATDQGSFALAATADARVTDEQGQYHLIDWKNSTDSSPTTEAQRVMQLLANKAANIADLEQRIKTGKSKKEDVSALEDELEKVRQESISTQRSYKKNGKLYTEEMTLTADMQEAILGSFGLDGSGNNFAKAVGQLIAMYMQKQFNNTQLADKMVEGAFGKGQTGHGFGQAVTVRTQDEDGNVVEDQQATAEARDSAAKAAAAEARKNANKKISEYLKNYKYAKDMRGEAERAKMAEQGKYGADLIAAQKYTASMESRASIAEQELPAQNALFESLRQMGIEEEKIAQLKERIAQIDTKALIKQQQRNSLAKEETGFIAKIIGGFKQRITWFIDSSLAYTALGKIRQAFNATINTVKELDKAVVNLQIASGSSKLEIQSMLIEYTKIARELGRTTQEMAAAANDWLRAGYTGKEAVDLTTASMKLSTLGMIDSSQATTYLISTLKGWKLGAQDVLSVVDKLTAVDMSAAISAGDLALAMSRANNSARLAGSSMDNYIGYVTTVADVSQKSAESVGEGFKTVYSRLGNVKAGKFTATLADQASGDYDAENYANLNDIETVLSSLGIKLRTDADTWRSADEVLADIGEKWSGWSQTTQNAVATTVAGTRQRENVITLFENWEDAQMYSKIAANSNGTADEKMEAYTDSIEAAQKRVTAALENITEGLGPLNTVIKGFYNALANTLDIFTNWGKTLTAMGVVLALFGNKLLPELGKGLAISAAKMVPRGGIGLAGSFLSRPFQSGYNKLADKYPNSFGKAGKFASVPGSSMGLKGGFNNLKTTIESKYLEQMQMQAAKSLQKYSMAVDQNTLQSVTLLQSQAMELESSQALAVSQFLRGQYDTFLATTEENQIIASTLVNNGMLDLVQGLGETERSLIRMAAEGNLAAADEAQFRNALKNAQIKMQNSNLSGLYQQAGGNIAAGVSQKGKALASTVANATNIFGMVGGYTLGSSFAKQAGADESMQMLAGTAGSTIITGVSSALMTAGPWGMVAGGLLNIGSAIWGWARQNKEKKKEEQLKKAKEEEDEAREKLNNAIGIEDVAKKYDKLVKGVDAYGKNLSLTSTEYDEFLDASTKLAETFPELYSWTDKAGNKFIELGETGISASDAISKLSQELRTMTSQQLGNATLIKEADEKLAPKEAARAKAEKRAVFEDSAGNVGFVVRTSNGEEMEYTFLKENTESNGTFYNSQGEAFEVPEDKSAYEYLKTLLGPENLHSIERIYYTDHGGGETLYDEEFALAGDANGDDTINMKDTLVERKYIAGGKQNIQDSADWNGDGKINMKDILPLRKSLAGVGPESPSTAESLLKDLIAAKDLSVKDIDTDNDGTITPEEKENFLKQYEGSLNDYELGKLEEKIEDYNAAFNEYKTAAIELGEKIYYAILGGNMGPDLKNALLDLTDQQLSAFKKVLATPTVFFKKDSEGNYTPKHVKKAKKDSTSGEWIPDPDATTTAVQAEVDYLKRTFKIGEETYTVDDLLAGRVDLTSATQKEYDYAMAQTTQYSGVTTDTLNELDPNNVYTYKKDNGHRVAKDSQWYKNQIGNSENLVLDNMTMGQLKTAYSLSNSLRGTKKVLTQSMIDAAVMADQVDSNTIGGANYIMMQNEKLKNDIENGADSNEIWNDVMALPKEQRNQMIEAYKDASNSWIKAAEKISEYADSYVDSAEQTKNKLTQYKLFGLTEEDDANKNGIDSMKELSIAFNNLKDTVSSAKSIYDDWVKTGKIDTSTLLEQLAANPMMALLYEVDDNGEIALKDNWQEILTKIYKAELENTLATVQNTMALTGGGITGFNEKGEGKITNKSEFVKTYGATLAKYLPKGTDIGDALGEGKDEDGNTYYKLNSVGLDALNAASKAGEVDAVNLLGFLEQYSLIEGFIKDINNPDFKIVDLFNDTSDSNTDILSSRLSALNKDYYNMHNNLPSYYSEKESVLDQQIADYQAQLDKAEYGSAQYYDILANIRQAEVDKANLNDEQLQDQIDNLSAAGLEGSSVLSDYYKNLIATNDSEKERIEYTKQYNDALIKQIEAEKTLLDVQKTVIDFAKDYYSGDYESDEYKQIMKSSIDNSIQQRDVDVRLANQAYDNAYTLAYDALINQGYSAEQAAAEAQKAALTDDTFTSKMKEVVSSQEEISKNIKDYYSQAISQIEDEISHITDTKPKQWVAVWDDAGSQVLQGSISRIQEYYAQLDQLYQDEMDMALESLEYAEYMTDEEIKNQIDAYNKASKAKADNEIQGYEDIKSKQDEIYQAEVFMVNERKNFLNDQKKLMEDYYSEELKKLNDKKESIERTNKLIELQNNLLKAQNEQQRVYVEGVGWTYRQNRNEIKDARKAIDDFYLQDEIDDLNNAKETESQLLQDRLDNYDNYLKAMEERYKEQERLQKEALAGEALGVYGQANIYSAIISNVDALTSYLEGNADAGIGLTEGLRNFDTAMEPFFKDVDSNIEKLNEAKGKSNEDLIDVEDFIHKNDNTPKSILGGLEGKVGETLLNYLLNAVSTPTVESQENNAETQYVLNGNIVIENADDAQSLFQDVVNTMSQKSSQASK